MDDEKCRYTLGIGLTVIACCTIIWKACATHHLDFLTVSDMRFVQVLLINTFLISQTVRVCKRKLGERNAGSVYSGPCTLMRLLSASLTNPVNISCSTSSLTATPSYIRTASLWALLNCGMLSPSVAPSLKDSQWQVKADTEYIYHPMLQTWNGNG